MYFSRAQGIDSDQGHILKVDNSPFNEKMSLLFTEDYFLRFLKLDSPWNKLHINLEIEIAHTVVLQTTPVSKGLWKCDKRTTTYALFWS